MNQGVPKYNKVDACDRVDMRAMTNPTFDQIKVL